MSINQIGPFQSPAFFSQNDVALAGASLYLNRELPAFCLLAFFACFDFLFGFLAAVVKVIEELHRHLVPHHHLPLSLLSC